MNSYISGFIKGISLGRLVLSLVLAITVWAYVMATQYPEKTLQPIWVDLADPKPPPGLALVSPPNPSNVFVTLSGPEDVVRTIVVDQIHPYLDLSTSKAGTTPSHV